MGLRRGGGKVAVFRLGEVMRGRRKRAVPAMAAGGMAKLSVRSLPAFWNHKLLYSPPVHVIQR